MKSLTRRELLTDIFSKNIIKTIGGTYREFDNAQHEATKRSCDEVANMIGKKSKKHYNKFLKNLRKEG